MALCPCRVAPTPAWPWSWWLCVGLVLLSLTGLAPDVRATVPKTIALQGVVTDLSTGQPLTGPEQVLFRLYDVAIPGGAIVLWQELQTVAFLNGNYRIVLGTDPLNPLFHDLFASSQVDLGITIGTDEELQPRLRLNSVPFAFEALT